YRHFLRHNIEELVEQCPDDLAGFMLDPEFPVKWNGLECHLLAIRHNPRPGAYVQRWLEWIADGCFDSADDERMCRTLYQLLSLCRDAPFAAVRGAVHAHALDHRQPARLGGRGRVGVAVDLEVRQTGPPSRVGHLGGRG
ncbi:hypothetical protein, partial [Bradyrhizobium sp. NBAIM08]|uniref:hypothetical protein n=1 Tax=Bradyrhizobium sp. NBAIM08 TaxID=2793815 RepID=UPI001CD722BB